MQRAPLVRGKAPALAIVIHHDVENSHCLVGGFVEMNGAAIAAFARHDGFPFNPNNFPFAKAVTPAVPALPPSI